MFKVSISTESIHGWMASKNVGEGCLQNLLLTAELVDENPGKDHGVILLLPLSLYHAVTPPAKLEREGLLRSAPCVALCPQLQRQQNLRMWLLP